MNNTVLLQEMENLESKAEQLLMYDSAHINKSEVFHLLQESKDLIEAFEVMVSLSGGPSTAQIDHYKRELLSKLEEIEENIGDKHFLKTFTGIVKDYAGYVCYHLKKQ